MALQAVAGSENRLYQLRQFGRLSQLNQLLSLVGVRNIINLSTKRSWPLSHHWLRVLSFEFQISICGSDSIFVLRRMKFGLHINPIDR